MSWAEALPRQVSDPPDDKKEGDLWYDTDNNTLNFWNGSEWVEIGTAGDSPVISVNSKTGAVVLTAADVGALAAGDNVSELNNDAGYLDEAEVNNILNGLNPDGSPNPGSEGYLKPGDDVSELNNDAGYLTSADLPDDTLWLQGSGAIYPKELTDNVQVGGTAADPNITLSAADGKAIFGSTIRVAGEPWNAEKGAAMAAGTIQACNITGAATFIGKEEGQADNFHVRSDGSVKIGGDVPLDPNISLDSDGKIYAGNYDPSSTTTSGAELTLDGNLKLQRPASTVSNAEFIDCFYGNQQTFRVELDGSAIFAGDVAIGYSPTFRDNAAIIAALPDWQSAKRLSLR